MEQHSSLINDGIIFQPEDTHREPLKWKYFSKISIDFLFVKNAKLSKETATAYELHSLCDKNNPLGKPSGYKMNKPDYRPEMFRFPQNAPASIANKPALLAFTNESKIDNFPCSDLHQLVVECGWRPAANKFQVMKIRWDKTKPNTLI